MAPSCRFDIEKVLHDIAPALEEAPVGQLLDGQMLACRKVAACCWSTTRKSRCNRPLTCCANWGSIVSAVRSAQGSATTARIPSGWHAIRALVSDIEMPELDGYSLARNSSQPRYCRHLRAATHPLDSTMNTEKARSVGATRY